jgi:hypothetical protein
VYNESGKGKENNEQYRILLSRSFPQNRSAIMQSTMNAEPEVVAVPEEVEAVTEALADPFDPSEVKVKPGVVHGNRALALAYVDARVIQDRLDEVLGVTGWKDEYECLPDGSVVCRLHLKIGGEWITKTDVGGPSEQPDEGDRRKAAFSDALKRAAVKFGIGRYLYRLPTVWLNYDPQKRQFTEKIRLPEFALPKKKASAPTPPSKTKGAPTPQVPAASKTLPADGGELKQRLQDYESRVVEQGRCQAGELLEHVVAFGVARGYGDDLTRWEGEAIEAAVEEARAFATRQKPRTRQRKEVA